MGLIYWTRGLLDKAEEFHTKSLQIAEKLGDQQGMAIQHSNLGILYKQKGNFPLAASMWQECLNLYKAMGIPNHPNAQKVHRLLAEIGYYPDVGVSATQESIVLEQEIEGVSYHLPAQDLAASTTWTINLPPEEK
ncbi:MAG: hypothetical protein BWK78_06305 [Thiotrichaceae bacterium IS1]|nr:MAG: hypothetical protein BWK78_06305 [Thiotrichaceae bacterium IS1]